MTEAFLKMIFEASVTAGIAAAAVMLIRIPLKKAPKRWSYLLWAVVFFRCLCPFSVESTVSLFNAVPDPCRVQVLFIIRTEITASRDTRITAGMRILRKMKMTVRKALR